MEAGRYYEAWTLEESKLFIKLYLDEVRRRERKTICKSIAQKFKRTSSSIEIRVKEVIKILSGATGVYPIVTPNMVQAIEEVSQESNISKEKMLFWFK